MMRETVTPAAIKEVRQKKGLSQQAFASLLGVSTSTVARWETGDFEPTGTAALVVGALVAKQSVNAPGVLFGSTTQLGLAAGGVAGGIIGAVGLYGLLKGIFEDEQTAQGAATDSESSPSSRVHKHVNRQNRVRA
jgi:DNA-binding XRE family transcriptional regulator